MLLRTGKLKPYRKLKPKMDNLSENEENKGEENASTEVLDLAIILKAIKNTETNMNQKFDELLRNEMLGIIDTNTNNQNKKIKDLECRTQNYVYSRVVPLENKIADCDKSIGEIHSDVSVLGRTVELIESDVKEMAREMQNLEVKCSKVKVDQVPINTNIPIVVQPADEKPKFDPSKRSGHPVKFLRKLENYLKKINEANKIDKAIECLEGDARIWAECYMQRWQNFEEFKEDFSRQFWSQDQQERIRASIYEPRIYNRRNGNFSQHIWYWVDKTQHLEPPIPEKILVNALCKHFSYEIETALIAARVTSVEELLEVLKGLENRNDGRQHRQGEVVGRRNEERRDRDGYRVHHVNRYQRGRANRGFPLRRGPYRAATPSPTRQEEEPSEN
ncbi:hypothetical protein RN001_005034 [Aquatica leii]|uniref:Uncharacterized protein n=1 Tax=Aquatica leii TaxID=1421715 RepID=A0AAN7SRZ5_9COLE|nr:hypothetical protein RN001_005034 [Aquatica leii]